MASEQEIWVFVQSDCNSVLSVIKHAKAKTDLPTTWETWRKLSKICTRALKTFMSSSIATSSYDLV